MQLGIFAKTFLRSSLEEIWDAVVAHEFSCVQFNFSCAGLATLPQRIDSTLTDRIRREMAARNLRMAAVSGTFNLIHPDPTRRRFGLERLRTLAASCERLGTSLVTLCTGTRDPEDMWRRHPENETPEAWKDLLASMGIALEIAEKYQLTLGIEPEVGNVVDSAQKARRLLDEMQSRRLGIIMDPANLFQQGQIPQMKRVLCEAFDLLGGEMVLAHAKDLQEGGKPGDLPAGQGVLDYELYLRLLDQAGYAGPLVLHGLSEAQVPAAKAFVRSKLPRQPRLL